MASTASVLHHHALATISRSSSSSQRPQPNIKSSKIVCRAQSKPLSNGAGDGDEVQGGVSRRSVLESLVVSSAAVGSALAAFVAPAYGDEKILLEPKGKTSWPELVGEKKEVAVATIEKENPDVKAVVLSDSIKFVDLMYNSSRVRVFVNEKGVVTEVPRVG